jgi:hypothetical protein
LSIDAASRGFAMKEKKRNRSNFGCIPLFLKLNFVNVMEV